MSRYTIVGEFRGVVDHKLSHHKDLTSAVSQLRSFKCWPNVKEPRIRDNHTGTKLGCIHGIPIGFACPECDAISSVKDLPPIQPANKPEVTSESLREKYPAQS